MTNYTNKNGHKKRRFNKEVYIKVKIKFLISHIIALMWVTFSIYLSIPWISELGQIITIPGAIVVIAGIGYIPGYINAFTIISLLLDKQPEFLTTNPKEAITVIIACKNEEKNIRTTLRNIKNQDYTGNIVIIVADNGSIDNTRKYALEAGKELDLNLKIICEEKSGKSYALNAAMKHVFTKYVITLDADTLLHKSAIRYISARLKSSPRNVCAIAGSVLVKNSRENIITKLQEWDYFLGIASIKRMQGLYQGTLVAQGAYSIYLTDVINKIGGWPDAIGEDIVLTWKLLKSGYRVYFEPLAVAFTEVPNTILHLTRQRSRWARGMIEALRVVKPWHHPINLVIYLTSINLIMPYLDFVYTFCWIPGVILAFFGVYWIAGPITLFVIPLALAQNYILYKYQQDIFKSLDLRIRKNKLGFIIYVFFYQILMSPMSIIGYLQELFKVKRVWK